MISRWRRKADTDNNRGDFEADELTDEHHHADVARSGRMVCGAARMITFIHPEKDPLGAGYHILQSKIAVGSGGFVGKGYMASTQSHLNFLPEHHTDFAFSMLAEEWGFIGAAGVLFLFLAILVWGLMVARSSRDMFGSTQSAYDGRRDNRGGS